MLTKIIALGLIGTLVAVVLKKYNKELIPFFEIALVCVAIFLIRDELAGQGDELFGLLSFYGEARDLFICLLKGAAITVLTRLSAQLCRESGNGIMGEIVEIGGRVMLIILAMPYVYDVASTALSFVK